MGMTRVARLAVAAMAACAIAVPLDTSAQQPRVTTLRAAHWLPSATSMPVPFVMEWLKAIEAASQGTLKIETYTAGQLGRPNDLYDMARDGIADITWVVPGLSPGRFPIFSAGELPFLFSDSPKGVRAFDAWYRKHAGKEMGDVRYCLAIASPGLSLSFTSKQVNSPNDIKTLRIRPASATLGRYLASQGASIIQLPPSEARQAFDRGLLDGITLPLRSVFTFNLQNAARTSLDMPMASATTVWVVNRRAYDGLPPQAKSAIDANCNAEWSFRIVNGWNEWEREGVAMLRQNGNTVYQATPEQRAVWRASGAEFHKEWLKEAAKSGINAEAELNDLKERLRAAGATD